MVLAFAGVMILVSVALTQLVSPWWWLLTTFVGLNLLQASITGFCPAAVLFRKVDERSAQPFFPSGAMGAEVLRRWVASI